MNDWREGRAPASIIDFHSHLLPGLDDGALDWEESLQLARMAVTEGITLVALTPHYLERSYATPRERVLEMAEEFSRRVEKAGLPLRSFPGMEVHITPELPRLLEEGELLTFHDAGEFLLVELPFLDWPRFTEDILFQVRLKGITPILAHPERNRLVAENPGLIQPLLQQGCLVQMNTGSITGAYGGRVRRTAEALLHLGAVHMLGTDAHSLHQRPPEMQEALERISHLLGPETARRIASPALSGLAVTPCNRHPQGPMP